MNDHIPLDDADLFRRWRAESGPAAPDELTLAAFAEDRLPPAETAAVAAWLARNPGAAEDIALARTLAALGLPPHDAEAERIAARAEALVGPANVVPFRRPAPRRAGWRDGASWTALAASVALVAWIGFDLGIDTWGRLTAVDDGSPGLGEVLDPSGGGGGLLGAFSDNAHA